MSLVAELLDWFEVRKPGFVQPLETLDLTGGWNRGPVWVEPEIHVGGACVFMWSIWSELWDWSNLPLRVSCGLECGRSGASSELPQGLPGVSQKLLKCLFSRRYLRAEQLHDAQRWDQQQVGLHACGLRL